VKARLDHRWDLSPREAVALQRRLAPRVIARGEPPPSPFLVAGCDAAGGGRWARGDERITAAVIVWRFPGWKRIAAAWAQGPSPMPYVPGLRASPTPADWASLPTSACSSICPASASPSHA